MLGSLFRNVDLIINTRVPLSLKRTPRHWAAREPMIVNIKKHARSFKGKGN